MKSRLAFLLTVAWAGVIVASIHYGFLNRFIKVAALHVGVDFFQIPHGYQNLLAGNSIFLTEISSYSDNASPYYNHPALAILVGAWTFPLSPVIAYHLFLAVSLLILLGIAVAFSRILPGRIKFVPFVVLLCPLPVYHMLWCGQAHIFAVLSISLVCLGLIGLHSGTPRSSWLVPSGVLVSLFSKPVAILFLPALLCLPETRKPVLKAIMAYTLISLAFLLVPRLNPGAYNATHWSNLFQASLSSSHLFRLVTPYVVDYGIQTYIYSLPRMLYSVCSINAVRAATLAHQATIFLLTLSILGANPSYKPKLALNVVLLAAMSHFLCYFIVLEYQYAAMSPVVLVLVWQTTQNRSRLLKVALAGACGVFIPTLAWLGKDTTSLWFAGACVRVLPTELAFIALAFYSFLEARKSFDSSLAKESVQQCWRQCSVAIALLATVVLAAYATIPNRLLSDPKTWSQSDWVTHFEDILSRPGVRQSAKFYMHRQLAKLYAQRNPALAKEHFDEASCLTKHRSALAVEVANAYMQAGQKEWAVALLGTLSPDIIQEPNARKRYFELKKMLGPN